MRQGRCSGLQRVYVDASDKKKLITVVVEGEKRARWASTVADGKFKIQTHEAEYLGILFALKDVQGDLEILSDSESIVKVLNGESRITDKTKPYVEKVERLCENRLVKFSYGSRDTNEASLKQEGYSLLEIRNADLRRVRHELRADIRRRAKKRPKVIYERAKTE